MDLYSDGIQVHFYVEGKEYSGKGHKIFHSDTKNRVYIVFFIKKRHNIV